MAPTIPRTALVPTVPVFTNTERLALAGFLAGHGGLTRQAYELDLRQFTGWCHQHQLYLFQARRADIEFFARDLDSASSVDLGRMSIHRRASLCEASAATPALTLAAAIDIWPIVALRLRGHFVPR